MPKYKSVEGKWIPVDDSAKQVCKDRGIDFMGSGVPLNKNNTGVQATAVFPKVATGAMDGTNIAEPTLEQKVKLGRPKKS